MKTLYTSGTASNAMENNLIPMINIIFLLLIFFMIAGQISQIATPPALDVPSSNSETMVKPQHLQISINAQQEYYLNDQRLSLDEIEAVLADAAQHNTTVNLLVDKAMVASDLDRMLALLRTYKVSKVALLTHHAEQNALEHSALENGAAE